MKVPEVKDRNYFFYSICELPQVIEMILRIFLEQTRTVALINPPVTSPFTRREVVLRCGSAVLHNKGLLKDDTNSRQKQANRRVTEGFGSNGGSVGCFMIFSW